MKRYVICSGQQEYTEIAWQEFDKNDRLVTKRKEFRDEKALDKFVEKLMEKDNFYQILAYK